MKKQVIYGLGLVLAAPLCAQGALYSPQGHDTKTEGARYGSYFAPWPNARRQQVDGENRGNTGVIGAINLRLDYRSHTSATTSGRKWSNVKVSIGEGDITKVTTTFASNFTTTPTTVFSNGWSLPTVTGFPLLSPATYGGLKSEYKIPFSSPWLYTGKTDLVHDWQFAGGTLDNNVVWAANSGRGYYFDGYSSENEFKAIGSTFRHVPATRLNNNSAGVTTRCNDSATPTTTGASMYLVGSLYGSKYRVLNYRKRLYFYHYSSYTAPGAPVIHGLSFQIDITGIDLGTGCNRLHLKGPMIVRPMMTMPASYSPNGYSEYRQEFIPWVAAMANRKIMAQGAWTDSVTKRFNLTQAYEITLPAGLPKPAPKRMAVYTYSGATATYLTNAHAYNPSFAYTSK